MAPKDIKALLKLRSWNNTELAAQVGVRDNTVHMWLIGRRKPGRSACILMRLLLAETREFKQ